MQRGTTHKPESLIAIRAKAKNRWAKISEKERSTIMKQRAAIRIKNKKVLNTLTFVSYFQ
jgi:hypothetical protein